MGFVSIYRDFFVFTLRMGVIRFICRISNYGVSMVGRRFLMRIWYVWYFLRVVEKGLD